MLAGYDPATDEGSRMLQKFQKNPFILDFKDEKDREMILRCLLDDYNERIDINALEEEFFNDDVF